PDEIREHEVALCDRLRAKLLAVGPFEFFGHPDPARRGGASAFRSLDIAAPELAGILDQAFDIAVRPGLHCAPYIHRALGTFPEGLVRVSPGPFTSPDDIDATVDALREATGGL